MKNIIVLKNKCVHVAEKYSKIDEEKLMTELFYKDAAMEFLRSCNTLIGKHKNYKIAINSIKRQREISNIYYFNGGRWQVDRMDGKGLRLL